ncbi:MAG: hypothetical protein KDD04_04065, partial [Sinomicrobium sp.]|nr:hypothetical protein [Sinomicrobium sp.]
HRILLDLKKEAITIDMGAAKTADEAITEIERLCSKILQLSIETEGVYVVEHLLLRPRGDDASAEKDAFYHYRMSLVFPSWPVRFQQKGFREQARTILSEIIPAHIRADCFWIGIEQMTVFEDNYALWMEALRNDPLSEETSRYATVLKTLLESYDPNPV